MAVTVEVMLTWRSCLYTIETEASSPQDVNIAGRLGKTTAMRDCLMMAQFARRTSFFIAFRTAFHAISSIPNKLTGPDREWTSM